MRTVTRIPNSFSTSTNDPLFRFRSVLRTAEDELGQHEKDEAFPSSFSLWKTGVLASELIRANAFSSIVGVLFLR